MAVMTGTDSTSGSAADITPALSRRWGWLLALGIVQLLAGAAAIALPPLATFVATVAFGWILALAGVLHVIHAFTVRQWRGFALHVVGGLLYGVAGVLLILNPLTGAVSLTLLLAALLIVEGVLRGVLAFQVRPRDGWAWFLAGGIASVILGALLIFGWPATALWAIGLLLGIELVFAAAMNISLALACRSRHRISSGHLAATH